MFSPCENQRETYQFQLGSSLFFFIINFVDRGRTGIIYRTTNNADFFGIILKLWKKRLIALDQIRENLLLISIILFHQILFKI